MAAGLMRPARREAGWFAGLSIRHKLLALALLPVLGVLPLLGAGLLWWSGEAIDGLLRTKVRADLAVARGYFERVLGEVGASTAGIAESHVLVLAMASREGAPAALLDRLAGRERLDFIRLLPPDPALPDGRHVALLSPAQQGLLGERLRARVPVALLDTRNAAPSARHVEDRAMVLLATHGVRDAQGLLRGHVQAGVLLNRNLPFIDHINEIVYPAGSLPFASWGSRGTATLFLDDVRISTNVRLFRGAGGESGERAIGTRVSRSVRDAVLGRGDTWLDRAFVVDDWYVSGYEPLADASGRRVGMLYVGVLERPFTWLKYGALASIGMLSFAVMGVASVVSLRWARAIFHPLERMEQTMQCVEGGDLQARVGALGADAHRDEIGRLAGHLDRLLDAIEGHTRELDAKVAERTRELQAAQQQLVKSEKLATVGQLTASIAHEVNNPIAVIQGNLDLLRELLDAPTAARVAPELRLVDEQIQRMRLIVAQLLQFARPTEFAGYVETLAPAQALEDCLVLVGHLLSRTHIVLRRDFAATRGVAVNRQELQQVLVNLLVNAVQAMEAQGGGTLSLATRDAGADGVEIAVADTGPGLPAELLAQLFQPFVTRKREGTGLGLWISRGIVERYGGDISAENRPGGGACFTLRLKAER